MSLLRSIPLPILLAIIFSLVIAVAASTMSPGGPRRRRQSGAVAVWILLPFFLLVAGFGAYLLSKAIKFTGFDF